MGSVFEGVHELLSRRVAIKVLHAKAAERQEARDRFIYEKRQEGETNPQVPSYGPKQRK